MDIKSIKEWRADASPLIIAGPCSAETEEQVINTALQLKEAGIQIYRAGIWKPRTRPNHFEGVGSKALEWLKRVKQETGMQTSIEVANVHHVDKALQAGVDILWIGARTSVNPFAVQEIANALKGVDVKVLVKNPINPDVNLWIGALERINDAGITKLGAIHRGFSTYKSSPYRNRPQWEIPLELKRQIPNIPMVCDPSHISGNRSLIQAVSQEALRLNFDGLMVESHINPDKAWSDAQQQITPNELTYLLQTLLVDKCRLTNEENLNDLRFKIDEFDQELLEILSQRLDVSKEIGAYKKRHHIKALQNKRWNNLLSSRIKMGETFHLNQSMVKSLFELIHEESLNKQKMIINKEL